jgi:HEPN domain-containing protein
MKRPEAEAARWLAQAGSDLAFAEVGVREGFFAQACFTCQQAAEKALKALHCYPNGLPGGIPAEVFTARQASEAVAVAREVLARARAALGGPTS